MQRVSISKVVRMSKVAADLAIHPSTLRRWCEAGEGPPHIRTPRGTYLFRIEDPDVWTRSLEIRPEKQRKKYENPR